MDHFVKSAGYYGVFAVMIGVLLDLIVIRKGLAATWLLPLAVGILWVFGDNAQRAEKMRSEQVALAKQLEICEKIGERDPQSIFQYRQVGYRCPTDGGGSIERWVNQ